MFVCCRDMHYFSCYFVIAVLLFLNQIRDFLPTKTVMCELLYIAGTVLLCMQNYVAVI